MKGLKLLILIFFTLFAVIASAQGYLEFVENKGQWDKGILYKGELAAGAFVLKPDGGYRMMLFNHEDYAAIGNVIHSGHAKSSPNHSSQDEKAITSTAANKIPVPQNNDQLLLKGHVYELKFLNANPNPQAIPDKPLDSYNNYFIGNDKSKWAGNCKIFYAVTYKDVYPNIDVRYYTNNNHLKYDIIVHPGGDASRIALYIDGADDVKLKQEQLVIKTSVDDIKESIPYTYESGKAGRKELHCRYDVKGNIIRFKIDETLNKQSTLIIDPQLVFSTFSGSGASNWGFTATYDKGGNLYGGGIVFGTGFPVSNGAFQTNFTGGATNGEGSIDIGIIKFDRRGSTRLYGTYIGGDGADYPHSLIVDANNNLIIGGKTTSGNYPSVQSTYGTGGGVDIILTKLNATGSALIGSRRIGGTKDDGVNIKNNYPGNDGAISLRRNYGDDSRSEVIVDDAGNIYLASSTQSFDFPVKNAAQSSQASTKGYFQDGVVIKTSPDLGTILFSTYLGGSDDDAAFVVALNPLNNNIYVAGATASTDFPGDKSGVKYSSFQGNLADGFVALFTNNGQLIKTSYFGTSGIDIIYGIQVDNKGFPYIMGTTTGKWNVANSPYNSANPMQSNGRQFIAKVQPDLSEWVYSAAFGTKTIESPSPNISPTAFLVDRCENVYVSGWGGLVNTGSSFPSSGTKDLPAKDVQLIPQTDGSDFYFFVMKRDAVDQLYGSWYGQNGGRIADHVDGGTSRFDPNGIIYQAVCANCNGPQGAFPTSASAYSRANRALNSGFGGCNLACFKIAFNLAGVGAELESSIKGTPGRKSGCVPLDVIFLDSLAQGKSYIWNFGDGSPQRTTLLPTINHTYTEVGRYTAMLISVDSSTCNVTDTSYITIVVKNDEAKLGFASRKISPPCEVLKYDFTNSSIAPAGRPFTDTSFNLIFGDGRQIRTGTGIFSHTYNVPGTYVARLVLTDTNYCNYPDSLTLNLRIASNIKAQFTTPPTGCAPYYAVINNTTMAGQDFIWDFGDGTTFEGADPPPHLYQNIGTYTIKLNVVDSNTCNKADSAFFTITVNEKPTALFTYSPQPPLANTAIDFTNNSTGGTRYKWFFGDGDSLAYTNIMQPVQHLYNASETYTATLIAYNDKGCSDTVFENINAITEPLIDIANAISPNNDGVNDKVFVRSFGITKMQWKIYNRWGGIVFETADKNAGWDGRYKGVLQAQDVYTYTLNVEFSDGTKYVKKGDITLLR